jgi:three-Cys-motif partner protein
MERVSSSARINTGIASPTDLTTDELLVVPDDHLFTQEIKPHSLEKIRVHNRYARIFTTAMRAKWKQLAYVGLYSGCGRAKVKGTGQIIETSALSVLRQPIPFDHYIFVDHDPDCIGALRTRCHAAAPAAKVTIVEKNVNRSAQAIRDALPPYGPDNGLLSFCFVDPFDVSLKFSTIRALSSLKIDFLILLMLGNDARRNFRGYFEDRNSTRIGDLIDCPGWRDEYRSDGRVLRFMLRKFDEAMQRIGYLRPDGDTKPVYAHGTGVLLYNLAFYSKNKAGQTLWQKTISSLARRGSQGSFDFGS